ncbi:zinc finger protein 22-like [Ornithodoros turicata]|uniref:zinc finger protein 22-like n=1 Tax=Ornithodoros turicata TaxID=34597 RepID=UPI003138F693
MFSFCLPAKEKTPARHQPQVKLTSILKSNVKGKGKTLYRCSHCKYSSHNSLGVMRHLRTHTGERPFECSYCSKRFAQKTSLTTHLRIHTGEKPFQCGVCSRSFTQSGSLTDHLRVHSGEKPYKCNYCGRCFAHKGHLTEHVRRHTGERPFTCAVCDKKFARRGLLKKHALTHTKQKRNTSARKSEERKVVRQVPAQPTRTASPEDAGDEIIDAEIEILDPTAVSLLNVARDIVHEEKTSFSDVAFIVADFEIVKPRSPEPTAAGPSQEVQAIEDDAVAEDSDEEVGSATT